MTDRQHVERGIHQMIERNLPSAESAPGLLVLAEAYAWTTRRPRTTYRASVDEQLRPLDRV